MYQIYHYLGGHKQKEISSLRLSKIMHGPSHKFEIYSGSYINMPQLFSIFSLFESINQSMNDYDSPLIEGTKSLLT